MKILGDFFKAFIYFKENGIPEKLAKELAEKLTGVKADDFNRNIDNLNIEDVQIKNKGQPKQLATKKMRGDLPFINTKLSNPMTNKMVLKGLDGTTESLYSQFRVELDAYKNGLDKNLKFIKENNIALSSKDKDNILYNIKLVNNLNNKVDQLADDLITDGKEPQQIFEDFKKIQLDKRFNLSEEKIAKDPLFQGSMEKIEKLIKEMKDIESGMADKVEKNIAKQKYQGKGYGPNEAINRTLSRQFLADEIEAGRIETTPAIYNAMRTGGHPFIDPIKVFRHHYGDNAFDTLDKYIDSTYDFMGGSRYPGRFEFRKLGLVVKNKNAPGKTYAHYSTASEIDAEIQSIDNLIADYQAGKSPMIRTKQELLEGIREQNKRRAQFVKIRNEIAPVDKMDMSQYTNKMLNDLAEEGNKLQDELGQLDETGSSKLPYKEFQQKSKRLEEIGKILEEAQTKPEDFFPDDSAEIIPIKEEGILTGVDNTAEKLKKLQGKTFKGVELYGDETFDELKYIDENAESLNGVHPRDMDPKEGFARGGIVEVFI
jgi:hypothetical protein